MTEFGFFHPVRGYWQTLVRPTEQELAAYPADTVEVPLKPSVNHEWKNGEWVYTQPALEPEPVIIIPAVTLWERMTDDEAVKVDEAMAAQPVRARQIFLTAKTFRSDHELWPILTQLATQLFSAERAAALLKPPALDEQKGTAM